MPAASGILHCTGVKYSEFQMRDLFPDLSHMLFAFVNQVLSTADHQLTTPQADRVEQTRVKSSGLFRVMSKLERPAIDSLPTT
jgi:hypothetical protein